MIVSDYQGILKSLQLLAREKKSGAELTAKLTQAASELHKINGVSSLGSP